MPETPPVLPTLAARHQQLLRDLAPQVLAAVVRRYGDFAASEDAVQEALIAAATQWPREGLPENPRGWLIQVAARRMTDHVRVEMARRHREALVVSLVPPEEQVALAADERAAADHDDAPGRSGEDPGTLGQLQRVVIWRTPSG